MTQSYNAFGARSSLQGVEDSAELQSTCLGVIHDIDASRHASTNFPTPCLPAALYQFEYQTGIILCDRTIRMLK